MHVSVLNITEAFPDCWNHSGFDGSPGAGSLLVAGIRRLTTLPLQVHPSLQRGDENYRYGLLQSSGVFNLSSDGVLKTCFTEPILRACDVLNYQLTLGLLFTSFHHASRSALPRGSCKPAVSSPAMTHSSMPEPKPRLVREMEATFLINKLKKSIRMADVMHPAGRTPTELLPSGVCIVGAPGTGKTTLMLHTAQRMVEEGHCPGECAPFAK